MDSNAAISVLSAVFATVSGSSVIGVILTRRSRKEREQDLESQEALKEKTVQEATDLVLSRLRTELEAAYADVERRRLTIGVQDERIDKQNRVIRRQSVRIDTLETHIRVLERWIRDVEPALVECGATNIPKVPAVLGIRSTDDEEL